MAKGNMAKVRDLLEQALAECDGGGMDDEEEDSMPMGKSIKGGKKAQEKKGKKAALSIAIALAPKKGKK